MAEGGKKDTGKKDAGKEEGGEATPKAAGRKKLLLLVGVAVILLAGGGGAAWYFLGKPKDEAAQAAAEQAAKAARPKTFSSLDPFVVNLADENGERLVQAGVVLEVSDAKIAADLTAQMPAVRNAILLLLSSKRSDELLTLAGKQALANEIALAAGMALGWRPAPPAPPPTARKVKATDDETKAEDAEAGTRKGDGEAKAEEAADDEAKPAKPKAAPKAPPRKAPTPNPIEGVHFSQFLVQ